MDQYAFEFDVDDDEAEEGCDVGGSGASNSAAANEGEEDEEGSDNGSDSIGDKGSG